MFEAAGGSHLVFRSGSNPSAASRLQKNAPNNLTLSLQPGVIIMDEHQDRPVLALLLETIVVTALIGTFFIYAYPNTGPAAATAPGDVAGLTLPR